MGIVSAAGSCCIRIGATVGVDGHLKHRPKQIVLSITHIFELNYLGALVAAIHTLRNPIASVVHGDAFARVTLELEATAGAAATNDDC